MLFPSFRPRLHYLRQCIAVSFLLILSGFFCLAYAQAKAVWYRYYDQHGVANISTSVTPNHIRHGYEALDRNMQVIRRSSPYRAENDNFRSSQRASDAKQRDEDAKLKRAYGSSSRAIQKQKDTLSHIQKQINFQNEQIKQLQKDRTLFQAQIEDLKKKRKPIPPQMVQALNNNTINLEAQKKHLTALQANYQKTKADYDKVIQRLKAIE